MKPSETKEEKQKVWSERLSEASEFPGSQRKYCVKHGISYSSFQYWKLRLKRSSEESHTKTPVRIPRGAPTPFIRVEQERAEHPSHQAKEKCSNGRARFVAEVLLNMMELSGGKSL